MKLKIFIYFLIICVIILSGYVMANPFNISTDVIKDITGNQYYLIIYNDNIYFGCSIQIPKPPKFITGHFTIWF